MIYTLTHRKENDNGEFDHHIEGTYTGEDLLRYMLRLVSDVLHEYYVTEWDTNNSASENDWTLIQQVNADEWLDAAASYNSCDEGAVLRTGEPYSDDPLPTKYQDRQRGHRWDKCAACQEYIVGQVILRRNSDNAVIKLHPECAYRPEHLVPNS